MVESETREALLARLTKMPYDLLDSKVPSQDFLFKLIVIGDSAVGKSCLMHRVCTNEFIEDHEVTVGVEFGTLMIRLQEQIFKLQIWDTAGQESFKSITKIFYRGAHCVILTYDITRMDTFLNLESWFKEVSTQSEPDVIVILVGNFKDKEDQREVSVQMAEEFRLKHKIMMKLESSAKTGHNVDQIFIMAAKILYNNFKDKIKVLKEQQEHKKKMRQRQREASGQDRRQCNC